MRARRSFAVLAALQLSLAAVHIVWLPELAAGARIEGVAAPYRQLLLLAVAAVGVLLAGMGGLAAWFAVGGHWQERGAQAFAVATAAAWSARAALELVFPVGVPLLGLHGLSPFILAGSLAICGLAVLASAWSGPR